MTPRRVRVPTHLAPLRWRLLALATCTLWACSGEPAEQAKAPEPIANPQLDLSFARIPEGFEVAINQGTELRLESVVEGREGSMGVEVGERSDFGIDLVQVVNSQKAIFEAKPNGSYSGGRKLMTPAGEAYYSRGQFDEDGARFEETRVFLLHPRVNALVTFAYRYPAGDADASAQRVQELFDWVGELSTEPAVGESASPDA